MLQAGAPGWLRTFRRYLAFSAVAHLAWESAHVPLYTIGVEGTAGEIASAVLHCTAGDLVIASSALLAALALAGVEAWPRARFAVVAATAVALGAAYTVYSEWANLARGAWAYSDAMPTLPPLGTGLSPLLQWMLLPPLGLAWARK